eukprot:scaffold2343_cov58-Phaeocystis_antarctica.AAC.2
MRVTHTTIYLAIGRHHRLMTDGGTGLFGVVLVLAICSSCPLLPSCGAAVAAGCRSLRSRAAVAWPRAARRAAAGCAAASAASRLRELLACAGATFFWVAGPTGPISTTHRPLSGCAAPGACIR